MYIHKNIFLKNLKLTKTYCSQRVNDESLSTAKTLRSLNLEYTQKPILRFKWHKEYEIELAEWNFEILDPKSLILNTIFHEQINQKEKSTKMRKTEQLRGRVLVSEFESTITDGGSEIYSKGLIDIYDLPPIDTWFYIAKKDNLQNIFAWIPEKFETEANNAIDMNILGILSWLENWDRELYINYQKEKL